MRKTRKARPTTSASLTKLVDEWGAIDAQLEALTTRQEEIRRIVLGQKKTELKGILFRLKISSGSRSTTAWKKIAMDLGATAQKIAANTTKTPFKSIRCTSLNTGDSND